MSQRWFGLIAIALATSPLTPVVFAQDAPAAKKPSPAPAELIEAAIRKDLNLPPAPLPKSNLKPEDSQVEVLDEDPEVALPDLPKGKDKLPALEAAAQQFRTAREAYALYRRFLGDPATTLDEMSAVEDRVEHWSQAAKERLMRVGKRWLPQAEAEELIEQAASLVEKSQALIARRQYVEAVTQLEKASRIDPDNLDAQFQLGVCAYRLDETAQAERRFNSLATRLPEEAAVLNNLGVCQVLLKKYAPAVKNWVKAANAEPDNETLSQNLGTFLEDVKAKRLTFADKKLIEQASTAYDAMKAANTRPAKPSQGYVLVKDRGE